MVGDVWEACEARRACVERKARCRRCSARAFVPPTSAFGALYLHAQSMPLFTISLASGTSKSLAT